MIGDCLKNHPKVAHLFVLVIPTWSTMKSAISCDVIPLTKNRYTIIRNTIASGHETYLLI